ncbi:hypothetical protein [Catalinimonas niigatensis]|nr:hypothetical protein [Catalinimonas niigatensis]WPP49729.1 hypothetical protein PZB72_23950 [Catalinimonas niigatensis]
MANIFITGSSTGLGLLAAKSLINQGHQVFCMPETKKEQRMQ